MMASEETVTLEEATVTDEFTEQTIIMQEVAVDDIGESNDTLTVTEAELEPGDLAITEDVTVHEENLSIEEHAAIVSEEVIEDINEKPMKIDDTIQISENLPDGVAYDQVTEPDQLQQPPPQYQNLIIQHMDIAEPLSTLKKLLELRLQCNLSDHQFYLQDSLPLETTRSLVDQCVQAEGMVQINLEVKSQPGVRPKINILDVLKPADETEEPVVEEAVAPVVPPMPPPQPPQQKKMIVPVSEEAENVTRWIVDQNFRREQERLKIPFDPYQWNEAHVRHWIQWAVREFSLENVDINNFKLTGKQLCELTHPQFIQFIPHDKGDVFWTHLELLRKCKFVAVMQHPAPQPISTITVSTSGVTEGRLSKSYKTSRPKSPRVTGDERFSPGNRTGNNGQIQLWQFLLELLTDKDCRDIIQWAGDDGEFKLNNPEMVAQLWGQRKNKPTMNYEKLSRALRYYYDGDMIAKVHGKRFVYKFVCDLKMLLGYSAAELNSLVTECAENKLRRQQFRETLRPAVVTKTLDQKTQTLT